jgi:hypothetical protein
MNALLTGLMSKLTGSTLSTQVGGRIYLDEALEGDAFPYVVFSIVACTPDDTFKNKLDDILIQFSLFSTSKGATEITTMYNNLIAILDDAPLSVTGFSHIWLIRKNLTTMIEEITTPAGTEICKHWAVDYSIMLEK